MSGGQTGAGAATGAAGQTDLATRDQQRPALGIRVGRDPQGRILISDVRPDSPAAQAGLQVGDEIVSIGDTPIRSTDQLVNLIETARVGESFAMQVRRDGQLIPASGQLSTFVAQFGPSDLMRGRERPALGIRVRENDRGRLEVTEVVPNSPAAAAGLRVGDEIQAAGNTTVRNFGELVTALDRASIGNPITINIRRNGQPMTVTTLVTSYAAMFAPTPPGATERQVLRRPLEEEPPKQPRQP